jgi:SAM-dependent methyltransferase
VDLEQQAQHWDARYTERGDRMWSGRPNGTLVAEVAALSAARPGRGTVLDVGCGEGADAIWFAREGWQVTAIDVSPLAVERARAVAVGAGVTGIDWLVGDVLATDVLATAFAPASFDLVSGQYFVLPTAHGEAALAALLDTVKPGGTLLMVHHAGFGPEQVHAHGMQPEDYFIVDDVARVATAAGFEIEVDEIRPRVDPPPGNDHVDDRVLRARRTSPRRTSPRRT